MNNGVAYLEPYLIDGDSDSQGKIMIGTVFGDMHDIGKNLVLTMLKGVGYETIDLGMNVKAEDFVKQVKEHTPNILGLSALLTTTMPEMETVLTAIKEAGLRDQVKIIVGGAPVNDHFAGQIGADGYAKDAGMTIDLVKNLID